MEIFYSIPVSDVTPDLIFIQKVCRNCIGKVLRKTGVSWLSVILILDLRTLFFPDITSI